MKGYVVVDANIWVARLVPQDAYHAICRGWLQQQRAASVDLLAPTLLLAETAGAVAYYTRDEGLAQRTAKALENLPDLRLVEMDSSLVQAAAGLAAELGLRGAFSFYVAIAARLKVPLATLNVEQGKRAAAVVGVDFLRL